MARSVVRKSSASGSGVKKQKSTSSSSTIVNAEEKVEKVQRLTASKRAGMQFPVTRIQKWMKSTRVANKIGKEPAIYMAVVLEYLMAEVLELAGNAARAHKRYRITPRHIMMAVRNDEELDCLLNHATIFEGGVLSHIQSALLKPPPKGKRSVHKADEQATYEEDDYEHEHQYDDDE